MRLIAVVVLVFGWCAATGARGEEKVPASLEGWFAYRYKGDAFGKCAAIDAREAATLKASYRCELGGRVNGAPGSAVRCSKGGRGVVALAKLADCKLDREEEMANGD